VIISDERWTDIEATETETTAATSHHGGRPMTIRKINCLDCGVTLVAKSNAHMRCRECADVHLKSYQKNYSHSWYVKHRKNNPDYRALGIRRAKEYRRLRAQRANADAQVIDFLEDCLRTMLELLEHRRFEREGENNVDSAKAENSAGGNQTQFTHNT
jgi:hypothetical protein